ncbi:uncharacterized protein LOC116336792 [Contarinia nasturtii]|uniref:uncharacterized protein LOC116336792 n=1 Tax=Contarinia nasturtii TaxID=265458 RepID=UPI0012D3E321|nr:uncharacterized protein LOC116336792 [Contarinia nasturtii]
MDWMHSSSLNRKRHRKRSPFGCGKSTSEPNLITSHFTPRFPDNLSHLIHEYVSVDELKFYRKRRPPNIDDEFHSKDSICLYDKSQPIIPFSAIKSEYTKKFGKIYSPRSRSVPNKFDLNATTKELLDALRDDSSDFTPVDRRRRAKTAKISGEIEIEGVNGFLENESTEVSAKIDKESSAIERQQDTRRTFKVQGELSYSSSDNKGEFKGQAMERSESNPQLSNIKILGRFHGTPEYHDSFKAYNHFTKSAPIKANDHLRVSPTVLNTAIVTPNISSLSEYTDQFKELKLHSVARTKHSKSTGSVTARNNLMIGHSDQHVFPEYFENYQNPQIKKLPERPKPRSPILQMNGSMDYNPEYRVKFTEFPRQRPIIRKPESYFDFFDRPRKSSPIQQAIITPKFNPNPHMAIVEPSQNIHQPPTIDKNPFYLCQPEVRKARREILIKKRPTSPRQTISAAVRSTGRILTTNEDDENRSYNERSRIVKSPIKPPIQVTIENVDEPREKPTIINMDNRITSKYGRRSSMHVTDVNGNLQTKRNASKIIEGNHEYAPKKKTSITSTTTTDDEYVNRGRKMMHSQSLEQPSFVILNDPIKHNKWMKSSWYL